MRKEGASLIALAGILYGSVTVGGSLFSKSGLSVLDTSFFFIFFSIFFLAPFALARDRKIFSKMKKNLKYLSSYAVVNLFLLLAQFGSLSLGVSPPTVAFLLYTQPVWTIILGYFIFKEKITLGRIGIILVALIGVLLITNPTSVSLLGKSTALGELVALSGGVFLSLWVILGKKGRLDQIEDPVALTFAVRTFSVIPIGLVCLGAFALKSGLFLGNPSLLYSLLIFLVLFSIVAGALPDYLFYRGVSGVRSLQAGVILLLEPVSATIMSIVLSITVLSTLELLGGGLILVSNYLVMRETKSS
ncbi:MAG: DMT family transporter [Nitrososphaerales archaeon]